MIYYNYVHIMAIDYFDVIAILHSVYNYIHVNIGYQMTVTKSCDGFEHNTQFFFLLKPVDYLIPKDYFFKKKHNTTSLRQLTFSHMRGLLS